MNKRDKGIRVCSWSGSLSSSVMIGIGAGPDAGDKPLQLRVVAAMLRKNDEPQGVIRALKVADQLIRQAPDELTAYAGSNPTGFKSVCFAGGWVFLAHDGPM